jgi:hypothetical protein
MAALLVSINLEDGMPTVEQARERLKRELQAAKAKGAKAVKLVHGYGSTGEGGALRVSIRASLVKRRKEGVVKAVLFGEKWDIFDPLAQALLDACPELRRDRDLCNCNPGISIVLL